MIVYLIFFIACFIQALGGFGAGLFAVPLLTLFYEPKFVIPPFSLIVLIFNLILIFEVRVNLIWGKIIFIIIGSFLGIPFGVLFLKYVDPNFIRLFISTITFFLGLIFFVGFKPKLKEKKIVFFISGIVSGVLSGSAAMGGPPLIFLMMSMGLNKDNFRASLLGCFLFNGIYANTLYFFNELLNVGNIKIFLFGILPALAGCFLGVKTKNYLSNENFNKIIVVVVILIGMIGMLRFL